MSAKRAEFLHIIVGKIVKLVGQNWATGFQPACQFVQLVGRNFKTGFL